MTDRTYRDPLDRHCNWDDQQRRHDQPQPVAGANPIHHGDQSIAPHRIEGAMSKIDNPAKAENQAKPEARQQQKGTVDDAIQDVDEQEIPVHDGVTSR